MIDLITIQNWVLFDPTVYLLMGTVVLGLMKCLKYLMIRK